MLKDDGDDKSLTEMSIRIRQTAIEPSEVVDESSREPSVTSSTKDEGIESMNRESTTTTATTDIDFKPSDIQKRLSCSSKQSTDSNSSSAYTSSNKGDGRASSIEPTSLELGGQATTEETHPTASPKIGSLDDELINMTPKTKLSALKSKTPELRRKKTSVTTEMNWEKTKEKFEKSKMNLEILRQNIMEENMKLEKMDPYHAHILLYFASYDTKQVLYAFQTLRNIIGVDARMFLWMALTNSISTPVRQMLEK